MRAQFVACALGVCLMGCITHKQNSSNSDQVQREHPTVRLHRTAVLSTNEVLQLAYEAARELGFRLDGYRCDALVFGAANFEDKWIVLFNRNPPVPDDYVFVTVKDLTREAEAWQP